MSLSCQAHSPSTGILPAGFIAIAELRWGGDRRHQPNGGFRKTDRPQLVPLAATQGRDFTNKSGVAGHPGAERLDIGSDVERLGVDEPADFLSSTQAKNSAPPMGSKAFEPGLRRNLRPGILSGNKSDPCAVCRCDAARGRRSVISERTHRHAITLRESQNV